VFWRRRLLVLAALIAILWAAVSFWPQGGDDPATTPTKNTATPTPVQATATDGPVNVTLPTGTSSCDPQKVRVTPSVRDGQQGGGEVEIGLVMSTTEDKSCTLTPANADLIAIISANDKAVWDSTVCKQSLLTEPVQLTAEWSTLVLTTWSGRGSGSTCSKKEGWAPGGDYTVQAGTLGGEPGKTVFKLKAAPKPTKTPTPSQTPTKKPTAKDTTKPND